MQRSSRCWSMQKMCRRWPSTGIADSALLLASPGPCICPLLQPKRHSSTRPHTKLDTIVRIMRRLGISILLLAAAVAAVLFLLRRNADQTTIHSASAPVEAKPETIVAPGRVEPASEEVKVSSQVPGKLSSVPLEEGDRVRRDQVIAVIANEDYRARLGSAEARLKPREARLPPIVNGSPPREARKAPALGTTAGGVL